MGDIELNQTMKNSFFSFHKNEKFGAKFFSFFFLRTKKKLEKKKKPPR